MYAKLANVGGREKREKKKIPFSLVKVSIHFWVSAGRKKFLFYA